MGLFKRRKPEKQPECAHKYRDFPWYTTSTYYFDTQYGELEIIEPYVCIYCGCILNKTLQEFSWSRITYKEFMDRKEKIIAANKDNIKPKYVVMDMIYDQQLVDREWLKFADLVARQRQNQ